MAWQVEYPGRFYDADEGSVVYFEPFSGDTHLLSDLAAFILQQFNGQAMETADIVTAISPEVDADEEEGLGDAVAAILEELFKLEIVTQV